MDAEATRVAALPGGGAIVAAALARAGIATVERLAASTAEAVEAAGVSPRQRAVALVAAAQAAVAPAKEPGGANFLPLLADAASGMGAAPVQRVASAQMDVTPEEEKARYVLLRRKGRLAAALACRNCGAIWAYPNPDRAKDKGHPPQIMLYPAPACWCAKGRTGVNDMSRPKGFHELVMRCPENLAVFRRLGA